MGGILKLPFTVNSVFGATEWIVSPMPMVLEQSVRAITSSMVQGASAHVQLRSRAMKKKSLQRFLIKVSWSKNDQNIHFQDFPEQPQHYDQCFWKTAPRFQNPAKNNVWYLSTIVFWGHLNTYFMIDYFRWIRCPPPHHNQKLAMGLDLICPPWVHLRA